MVNWNKKFSQKGLGIRSERIEDIAFIRDVHNAAFEGTAEGKLVDLLRDGGYFTPEMSLVCTHDNNKIVGHVLFSDISLKTDDTKIKTAALAPVAVRPDYQAQGIGSALIDQGIDNLKILGYEAILVLGHPAYYPRFGFNRDLAKDIECKYQCDAFMGLELVKNALKNKPMIGEYPKPFNAV